MAEVEKQGWDAMIERVVQLATKHIKYLRFSFDGDVLDPAFEPGTGAPLATLAQSDLP